MRIRKLAKPLQRTEDSQADCFWHDNSCSLRYLLMLPGISVQATDEMPTTVVAQLGGSVRHVTKEYRHLVMVEPGLLPWEHGPVSVMLIL